MRIRLSQKQSRIFFYGGAAFVVVLGVTSFFLYQKTHLAYDSKKIAANLLEANALEATLPEVIPPTLDKEAYDKKLLAIANNPAPIPPKVTVNPDGTTTTAPVKPTPAPLWPVKTAYPKAGALLPFNRIIAYYGNFYSKGMGVLGQYPTDVMLAKLNAEVKAWEAADPSTPVIPAIHYIAVTAQGSAGRDGKYRLRMPHDQIDHALELARKEKGILFIDIQTGLSNAETEVPLLEKYLMMPDVHLGIDPEFYMKGGQKPGSVIGTMDATDINWTSNYLAGLVKKYDLPPKIFVLHRFTNGMITNTKNIVTIPEVQIVMHMDGWGFGAKKINTYKAVIYPQPVQFTGFKIFYKNDLLPPSTKLLTPAELLKLSPAPSYIQYQ